MSDILTKVNQVGLNTDFPVAGQNNSSDGFRTNSRAVLAGLTQANDELTRIQNTRFSFAGDAQGQSNRIGNSTLLANGDSIMEVAFTLADVSQGPLTLDTRAKDFLLTFDTKGRMTLSQTFSPNISFAEGHTANGMIGVEGNSLGSGSGSIVLPTFGFNAMGRLIATGKTSVSFGLLEHTLAAGSILIGNKQNKSTAFAPPPSDGNYALVGSGTTLTWQPVGTGTVSGIIGGLGITVTADPSAPTVALDFTELSAQTTIQDTDQLVLQTANGPRLQPFSDLYKIVKVVRDTAPVLGNNLDVKSFAIQSSNAQGVLLKSSTGSTPGSSLTVSDAGLNLQGSAGAPITLNAPSLVLNGLAWVTTRGAQGQFLTQGPTGLTWTTMDAFYQTIKNTIFVGPDGDDAFNNGSMNSAFKTIGKAISAIPDASNDLWTIMLLGGTYQEDVVVQNKKRIALEGFFSSTLAMVKGRIQVTYGVDELYMSKITWDDTARAASDTQPTFVVLNGLVKGLVKDCEFLRADRTQPALELYGQTTGPVRLLNVRLVGSYKNQMTLSEQGSVTFDNLWNKLGKAPDITSITASRQLTMSDIGTYVRVNISNDNTITVAETAVQPMPLGATVRISQIGTGRTSVVPLGNVTINTPNGYVLRKRYSTATLTYVGQDIWDLNGDLDENVTVSPVITSDNDTVTVDNDTITVDNG